MNQKKIPLICLVIISMFIFSFAFVSSATVINTPSASSTVMGATIFNITVTEQSASQGDDLINLTYYAKSLLTANSTWVILGSNNSMNMSLLSNETIISIDLTGVLEDAPDYIFNVTAKNASGGQILSEDTNIAIIVDQTIPQAPTLSPTTNTLIVSSTTQTFTGTVIDANTTSCTYVINRYSSSSDSNSASGSGTYSGSSCTFTKSFTSSSDNGDYTWYVTASDGTNTTVSSTNHINVQIPGSSGGALPSGEGDGISGDGSNTWKWVIGVIVVAGIFAFIYFASKK